MSAIPYRDACHLDAALRAPPRLVRSGGVRSVAGTAGKTQAGRPDRAAPKKPPRGCRPTSVTSHPLTETEKSLTFAGLFRNRPVSRILRPTSRLAGRFGFTIRFRVDPLSAEGSQTPCSDAPVIHGLCCLCQERQRHHEPPTPVAYGARWSPTRKFAPVWADTLRRKRARVRRRRR
jgi:hypothetical protein